ncbi:putative metal-dependent hydrolase of the TIM-barrel fold protein [Luteitalea pratensis]|uniref:Putative metal-dependent hydrolase of the TIM-barrel fold protein n=1 Tax=Luteitalea pratensis TaxID=1855912 RepID=A0A143PV61_LUTPR|nr:dipeptidase [Luteitalea pratensis]AMY11950.1 putative metal-dependent hydrolase of the TIM-barrel fold protein [Luteitalea pratensis]
MRSQFVAAAVPFLLLVSALAQEAPRVSEEARRLHQDAFVFDGHVHMINRQLHLGGNIGDRLSDGQVDLPRMKEGGVDAFFMTLFVMEQYYPARYETKQTLRLMNMAIDQLTQNREVVELALNASDIERINRAGKMAAVLDLEGSFDLDGDLHVLRSLHRLGLRVVQLPAHNWGNEYADSCCAPARWHGLTEHGRAVVREMNRLGMVINVSHASDETLAQALEVSTQPIVATHHGLRSLNDIPRNMPDDLLKKLAAKGGVIGFHIGNAFHNRRQFEWLSKQAGRPFWDTSEVAEEKARLSIHEIDRRVASLFPMVGPVTPDDLLMSVDEWVGVVDRAIQVAGEDHVALGSDFDGGPTPARHMRDVRDLAMITDAMLRRGYSKDRIRKFLGGNLMRVFRQVTSTPG